MSTDVSHPWEIKISASPTRGVLHTGGKVYHRSTFCGLRESVLGSVNGSKRRRSRRSVWFNVVPEEGKVAPKEREVAPEDHSEISNKRLELLGARCGSPLWGGLVDRPSLESRLLAADMRSRLNGEPGASSAASARQVSSRQMQGLERRGSCPPAGTPVGEACSVSSQGVRHVGVYPKASSCDAKVTTGEPDSKPPAARRVVKRGGSLQERRPQGGLMRPFITSEPQREAVMHCRSSDSDESQTEDLTGFHFWSPAAPSAAAASLASSSNGEPPMLLPRGQGKLLAGMQTSMARSDPLLLVTSIAEDEGCMGPLPPVAPVEEAESTSVELPQLLLFIPKGRPGQCPGATCSGSGVGGGHGYAMAQGYSHESSGNCRRPFGHFSADTPSLGEVRKTKQGVPVLVRKGTKKAVVLGRGARMVQDEKAQEYYERD